MTNTLSNTTLNNDVGNLTMLAALLSALQTGKMMPYRSDPVLVELCFPKVNLCKHLLYSTGPVHLARLVLHLQLLDRVFYILYFYFYYIYASIYFCILITSGVCSCK